MYEIQIIVAKTLGNIFMKNKIISLSTNINFKSLQKCLFLVRSLNYDKPRHFYFWMTVSLRV
jgi:hypothetical protein